MHWLLGRERLKAEAERTVKSNLIMVFVGTVLEVVFWKGGSRTERAKCFEVPREPAGNGTRSSGGCTFPLYHLGL